MDIRVIDDWSDKTREMKIRLKVVEMSSGLDAFLVDENNALVPGAVVEEWLTGSNNPLALAKVRFQGKSDLVQFTNLPWYKEGN